MSVLSPPDAKKLIEALLCDLRQLSTEAKKKYSHVKEASESGVARVRNISTASGETNLLTNLRAAGSELLHPLILACSTRQTRLVQIALLSIQRLIQHRILEASCANVVVSELWGLVEAECEELRVLQTVPPLVSADLLVTGNALAKVCIVMCFRMHFSKDPVVINAASAAVRQLVGSVFERVIQPTECEIFLSSLMKFVDVDHKGWQRALSLEALHRIIVRQDIVRLDSLERHEAGVLPDGYVVSRAASVLNDFVQTVYATVDAITVEVSSFCSSLVFFSTDETLTEQLLCGLSSLVSVGCKLKIVPASLNCLYVLCCTCLPSITYLHSYAAFEAPKCEDLILCLKTENPF
ncbi:hypothetical protein DICVIV_11378 [Dictyocaulus viviparus]|uniref:Mon2/Sec7/BIG1-like dimerisation and cyclophilin-binding domain-containing protein n=1 Tax=Dictyocaulus viviparus TaxID=29172 RepID=A0A0D8XFV8_DICVI|nr:hypothetical protein DICVIV_11378 [Dictyocaulus viviparus]